VPRGSQGAGAPHYHVMLPSTAQCAPGYLARAVPGAVRGGCCVGSPRTGSAAPASATLRPSPQRARAIPTLGLRRARGAPLAEGTTTGTGIALLPLTGDASNRQQPEAPCVAELAKAVADKEVDTDLVTRRIRHWTLGHALAALGPAHSGTGRHRRYGESAAYHAVLLNWLTDWGLSISILQKVSERLQEMLVKDPQWRARWNDAIDGSRGVWMLLTIQRVSADRGSGQHQVDLALKTDTEIAEWIATAQGGVIVRLTDLFRRVSL
jgi:hypothetical protein